MKPSITALAFSLALVLIVTQPARADTLIDNVNGMSLDRDGKVERFTGLLLGDDGRIEQVLQRSDKRPGKVDYKVDGKGRTVIPGFVDSHIQLMPLGLSLLTEARPAAQPRPEDRDQALLKAQQALLAHGITAVTDMGTTIEDWQTYRRAGDAGALQMRIMAYAEGVDAMILIGGPGPTPWLYDDRLRLNGVKLTLDGPLLTRAAALKAPYADAPASKVALRLSETQFKNLMSRAAMDNFQAAVEASGDKAVQAVIDALTELSETYKGERRWRIENAEAVDPNDLPGLTGKGVIASLQPQQVEIASTLAEARLGPVRVAGAYAWKSLTGAGAGLAFGSGAPKIRAMQILAELEPTRRDIYAGAIGYIDFAGNPDFCIAIRTITIRRGVASVQAGAGIVADSNPAAEYEETKDKARALLQALAMAEAGL